jgi:hypothetical protein
MAELERMPMDAIVDAAHAVLKTVCVLRIRLHSGAVSHWITVARDPKNEPRCHRFDECSYEIWVAQPDDLEG